MKKRIILILLLLLTAWIFGSCTSREDAEGGNNSNIGAGNYYGEDIDGKIFVENMTLQVVINDDSVPSDVLSRLEQSLYDSTGVFPRRANDDKPMLKHELIIGESQRPLAKKAYKYLDRLNDDDGVADYVIYSDGNSVALAYEKDKYASPAAVTVIAEHFLENYLDGKTQLTLPTGAVYADSVDPLVWQKAIDEEEFAVEWEYLRSQIKDQKLADSIVNATKQYYDMMDPDVVTWIANLYDPNICYCAGDVCEKTILCGGGGFYYSNSGRNNVGYKPDIESTAQAISFLTSSGVLSAVGGTPRGLPDWIKTKIGTWVKSLQQENGFFYHPQWGVDKINGSLERRGRDLTRALELLGYFGYKPTYNTSGAEGDYTLVDGTVIARPSASRLTEPLKASSVIAASRLVAVKSSSVAPDHMRTEAAFREYLASLDIKNNGYGVGNELASQASQIVQRENELKRDGASWSIVKILEEWLLENQNPQNGLWYYVDKGDPKYSVYDGVNGLLKISALYNTVGMKFNYPMLAIEAAIQGVYTDEDPLTVCYPYNTWFSINNIFINLRKFSDDKQEAEKTISEIRTRLLNDAPNSIMHTAKKVALFMKEDGSFSYYQKETNSGSQGMPVAIPHTNEGDMNATVICGISTAGYMFECLGLDVPRLYGKTEYYRFISEISEMGDVIKNEIHNDPPVTFDNDTVGGEPDSIIVETSSSGIFRVEKDPRDGKRGNIYRFESKNDGGDSVRIECTNPLNMNAYAFEGEFCVESGNGYVSQIVFGECYMLGLRVVSDYVEIFDSSSMASTNVTTDFGLKVKVGEWFKLRMEYYVGDHDSVRMKLFINDVLVAVNDNYYDHSGYKIANGRGNPSNVFSNVRIFGFSNGNITILMDNLKLEKSNDLYIPADDPDNQPLYNIDAPNRDEVVYDFEASTDGESYPYDFEIEDKSNGVSVEGDASDRHLSLNSSQKQAYTVKIPINVRTKESLVDVFEAEIGCISATAGAGIDVSFAEKSDDKKTAFTLRLSVIEENGERYLVAQETADGTVGAAIHGTKLAIGAKAELRLEYYQAEKTVLLYINGSLVASSNSLDISSASAKINAVVITPVTDKQITFALDDIKVERIEKDFSEATKPSNGEIVHSFENDIGNGVIANSSVKVEKVGSNSFVAIYNGGVLKLPVNKRSQAINAYIFKSELKINKPASDSEIGKISFTSENGEILLAYTIRYSESGATICELTKNKSYESAIAEIPYGKNVLLEIEYYPGDKEAHIYLDESCVAVSSMVYDSENKNNSVEYFVVEGGLGSDYISLDNCILDAFTKLLVVPEISGDDDSAEGDKVIDFEDASTGRLPNGIYAVSSIAKPFITESFRDKTHQKVLAFITKAGSYDKLYLPLTEEKENAVATIIDTMICITYGAGSESYFEIYLTDEREHTTYLILLKRDGNIIKMSDISGTSETNVPGRIAGEWVDTPASVGKWFNLKLIYYYNNGGGAKFETYINDALAYESDNFYGKSTINTNARPTGNANVLRINGYSGTAATILVDDFSFVQTEEVILPTPPVEEEPKDYFDYEDGELPPYFSGIRPSATNSNITVVEDDSGKTHGTNVLKFHNPIGDYTEFDIKRFETTSGANATVFESDVFINRLEGSSGIIKMRIYIDGYGNTEQNQVLLTFPDTTPSKIAFAGQSIFPRNDWFKLRIEYRYGDNVNTQLIIKVNDVTVFMDTIILDGKVDPSTKLNMIRFTPDTACGVDIYFDNTRFKTDIVELTEETVDTSKNFEDGEVPSNFGGIRGSATNTTASVVEDDSGKNHGTRVLKFHNPAGEYTEFQVTRFENNNDANLTVFESDMYFAFHDGTTDRRIAMRLYVDGYSVDGTGSNAQFIEINEDGKILFRGRDLGVKNDSWHKFRIEYHYEDKVNTRLVIKVDGVEVYTDTIVMDGAADPFAKLNMIRFTPMGACGVDIYFDNVSFKTDKISTAE